jgi:hypothetical protein
MMQIEKVFPTIFFTFNNIMLNGKIFLELFFVVVSSTFNLFAKEVHKVFPLANILKIIYESF